MSLEERVRVLVLADDARRPHVRKLADELRGWARVDVEETADAERLVDLRGVAAVYADWGAGSLSDAQADSLSQFVHSGGGVVAAGPTLATWADSPAIVNLSGWKPDGRTVHTELRVRSPEPASAEFHVRDRVHVLPEPPADAEPLLRAPWRYSDQVVAYDRPVGAGHFVYLGLGNDPGTYEQREFRRTVARSLRRVASDATTASVRVGLLGYGALGAAHGAAIATTPGLELAAVCDRLPARRDAAASLQVSLLDSAEALCSRDDVDLVVVGLPPVAHAAAVMQLLAAGKHVVCEKPFALEAADCDRMMACAAERGLLLTVFQNRRWDPDFIVLRECIEQGAIGDVFYLESFVGGFAHPCSYWHSHEPISGGAVYDWGSHYIDWVLQLIPSAVRTVRARTHKRVWHDVTNADQTQVEIVFAGGEQAMFLQSDVAAALKPKWYVLGTRGAATGEWQVAQERSVGRDGEIDERQLLPTDLPARIVVHRPHDDRGVAEERLPLPTRDRLGFYRNLVAHVQHGEPLAVTAAQARRTVAVMEAAMQSARQDGAPIHMQI